ncbi:tRNA threonylcarbamoyladenosine dehydratase [Flavonifractor sp. An135]|nr:tRNA threonylcarbamoyladenosine dehydratase [Flavonifractor sp. An135]OUQ21424.1 tRNA threonylcarbamoyladenosine dehydratase [Flavonifractor sp. An135]
MDEQFARAAMLLGAEGMEKLWHSHVAVFGLGGVGSWCAEALARSGVGALTLIDHDDVGLTNLNRQAEALHSTLGQPKAEAMAARIRDISPKCAVTPVVAKYDAEHRDEIFSADWNYIVDAIDLVSCKLDLIETARSRGIPMISALGTGNKLDPTLFRISSIAETEGCPLARVMRKELRKRGITDHRVIWSPELPAATGDSGEAPPPGRRSIPASVVWVPACAGLMMAGDVIRTLTGK